MTGDKDPFEDDFEEGPPSAADSENLRVDVAGFEGPLDLLLSLARKQKVDMRQISMLDLAEQYIAFVERAKALRIELAADYLVMAAWLAFIKSRLLLPEEEQEDGPTAEEHSAHLAFQLERLHAMREVAARLMGRDQLGRDVFCRGIPEDVEQVRKVTYTATLLDIMQGYARIKTKDAFKPYELNRDSIYTLDQALTRLKRITGAIPDWRDLAHFMPQEWMTTSKDCRTAVASVFAATLELAKSGQIEIRQADSFTPIEIRTRAAND